MLDSQALGTLQALVANEKMTDLLVELIHGAHLKNKKGGLGALKRKVAAAAQQEVAKKERKLMGASKAALRKQGGSSKQSEQQFVQVCTVKRDRRTIEDIEARLRCVAACFVRFPVEKGCVPLDSALYPCKQHACGSG